MCYLKEQLGIPLTLALAEITAVQPRDPIQYLGHWLFKYRYNQEVGDVKRIELQQLIDERQGIAAKKWVLNFYYVVILAAFNVENCFSD